MKTETKVKILMEIKGRSQKLLPSKVIAAAKDPDHPLHSQFCWDDTVAAHRYRIWQARQMLAEVEILISDPPKDSRFGNMSPAFVSLGSDRKDGGYRPIGDVLNNAALRQEMVETALGELRAMQFRYDRLSELAGVWKEAEKIESKHKGRKAG